jgi:hypothetical protein
MPLKSATFSGDARLEACLVDDQAHLTRGVKGDFVSKVQAALMFIADAVIDETELDSQTYGPSTAAAVLDFKQRRQIINRAYQQKADNIVGKMTIKALDDELAIAEAIPDLAPRTPFCPERI